MGKKFELELHNLPTGCEWARGGQTLWSHVPDCGWQQGAGSSCPGQKLRVWTWHPQYLSGQPVSSQGDQVQRPHRQAGGCALFLHQTGGEELAQGSGNVLGQDIEWSHLWFVKPLWNKYNKFLCFVFFMLVYITKSYKDHRFKVNLFEWWKVVQDTKLSIQQTICGLETSVLKLMIQKWYIINIAGAPISRTTAPPIQNPDLKNKAFFKYSKSTDEHSLTDQKEENGVGN